MSVIILLALCFLLMACQKANDVPAETPTVPLATEGVPAEPDETRGEPEMSPVEQPKTDEEMNVDNLLVPDVTEGETPSEEGDTPVVSPTEGETLEPSEPDITQPEETLPDTTQPPNDGYSENWY